MSEPMYGERSGFIITLTSDILGDKNIKVSVRILLTCKRIFGMLISLMGVNVGKLCMHFRHLRFLDLISLNTSYLCKDGI